jgi:hypothetical protein
VSGFAVAFVQQHLGKDGKVIGSGEQPGVPGDSIHPVGCRVVYDPGLHLPIPRLGWRDATCLRRRGSESGIRHSEWSENALGAVLIERQTRHALHQLTQNLKVDVTIDKAAPARSHRLFRGDQLEGGVIP